MYNKRTWLNPESSYASSNVVAFDGEVIHRGNKNRITFLSVSDCNMSITLNRNEGDTDQDFINKIKLLRDEINLFINHLEKNT
jgi:hypothetical protein